MAFVRNAWYVACWQNEVKIGATFSRQILGEAVVFYRKENGDPVALQDSCPHRFIPLSRGRVVQGDRLECAYHGLQFDCSGRCVKNPHGDGHIPAAARVNRYPVQDRYGMVWIWMGGQPADPATIPDYSVLEQEDFTVSNGYLHIAAAYELMAENLLDLSHITYLHDGYLGSPEQVGADQTLEQLGEGLQCNRWMPNVSVPGIFDMIYRQDGQPVDMWTNMRWMPPGCFLLDSGVHAVGGQREDHGWYHGIHILTPETEHSTHYHFAAAMPPGTRLSSEAEQKFRTMRRYAFEAQDKPLIDIQQQIIGDRDFWSLKPVLLSVDAGPVRMRRTLERMIAREQAQQCAVPSQTHRQPETA